MIIAQYAGSPWLGMEYRPHWLALEWQKLGHEVLIVSADWTHLRRFQPPCLLANTLIDGVEFSVLPVVRHHGNGAARFANILSFTAGLNASTRRLARWRPDLVIASSTHPLDVRPAARIASRAGARLVHEVHDLWPLTPRLIGGLKPSHPMIRLMQREEDFACQRADAVISILPGTREYLQHRGLDPAKWTHVSNGVPAFDLNEGPPIRLREEHPVTRIGYFGGHGPTNDVGTLLTAARILRDEPVQFHLTGSGIYRRQLMSAAAPLPKVHFHDVVEPAEARRRMRDMDALWWGVPASPLYTYGLGLNKVFEYMASGVPQVCSSEYPGPSTDVGCAMSAPSSDPGALAQTIRLYMRTSTESRMIMGAKGQQHVFHNATYPHLAMAFLAAAWRSPDGLRTSRQGDGGVAR